MIAGKESDWQWALNEWNVEVKESEKKKTVNNVMAQNVPAGWWLEAFDDPPSPSAQRGHACGEKEMLIIIAYDISNPKRLSHIARHCEDHGVRVQYSIFECRMEMEEFEMFWLELQDLMEPSEDRLVAYRVCASCAERIYTAGTMVSNQQVVAYIF